MARRVPVSVQAVSPGGRAGRASERASNSDVVLSRERPSQPAARREIRTGDAPPALDGPWGLDLSALFSGRADLLHSVIENLKVGLALFDKDLRLRLWSRELLTLLDLPPRLVRDGLPMEEIIRFCAARGDYGSGTVEEVVARRMARAKSRLPLHEHSYQRRTAAGRVLEVRGTPLPDGGLLTTYIDMTERHAAAQQVRTMALQDPLTGLSNRAGFRERLKEACEQATRTGRSVALMMMDLDNFKDVNDSLGHLAGDKLLIEMSDRLRECVRNTDRVARLGGDEFAVIASNLEASEDYVPLAQRIVESLRKPAIIDGQTVHCPTSIGITVFPHDNGDVDALIRNADLALYAVKEAGRNDFRVFDRHMQASVNDRLSLQHDLRDALDGRELELFFQPQVDLRSLHPTGFEALLRWNHAWRGYVSPALVIPAAERSNLIHELTEFVLAEAARQYCVWRLAGYRGLRVAVNVSTLSLKRNLLVDQVRETQAQFALPNDWLEIEITEGWLSGDDKAAAMLAALRDLGVTVAIDDFGTGYSSLSRLRDLPIDSLKIDRSFLSDVAGNSGNAALVQSIVDLALNLGLGVIAEGVEQRDQVECLRAMGCRQAQGYLFGKPMPGPEVPTWLATWHQGRCLPLPLRAYSAA